MTWHRRGIAFLAFTLLAPLPVFAWWPPANAVEEIGLPQSTDGGLEIRVWLGGGVTRPFKLYRVYETHEGVSGQWIVWAEVTHAEEDWITERQASRETAKMRRFLEKHYCDGGVNQTTNYLWCAPPLERDVLWEILLDDLMVDRLWNLPVELKRECGWMMEDGEIVAIEVLKGNRHHQVEYGNPEFCCTDIACAIANHVRDVVRDRMP